MRIWAIFFLAFVLSPFVSQAAPVQTDSTDFTVRVFAGSDTEPPTTPTITSAVAISQNQIDLAWTTATDNFILSGYVLFRDGLPIATTTLTTFSDAGLLASTTYNYFVQAFDSSNNYSTSSATSTITTPDNPLPTATSSSATEASVARVVAESVVVEPNTNTASFAITTTFPTRFEIRWGRTASYELGFITSDILRRDYQTLVTELEPGTKYEYEIIGYTPSGQATVIERGQFRTLGPIDSASPVNVERFTAVASGEDVELEWRLPDDDSIDFVRIVRSHLGYPASPVDGAVVYQGTGERAVDLGVLALYSPAYYTAFLYDTVGNVSSGAIAIVFATSDNPEGLGGDVGVGLPIDLSTTSPMLPPLATTSLKMPDPFEISISQIDAVSSFGEVEVQLDGDEPFLISVPADAVTQNLKSIIVHLQDPTDQRQAFAFLLRLNKDQTAYEAVVAPLRVSGRSAMVLSVYDFRELRVAEYRTTAVFSSDDRRLDISDEAGIDRQLLWSFWLIALGLLGLLLWWLIVFDRDDEDEDTEATTDD